MLRLPARYMYIPVGFVSRLDEGMGPKLKRKLKRQGVHLLVGVVKKGAGSQPRFVEKFTSRLEINGKGWFSASHAEQETSPFDQCIFAFERTMHSRLFYLLIFSSVLSQQLAKSV
jgi:hypothetical protein